MGKLNIDILGKQFTVAAKEDDAYLQNLLDHYGEAVQHVKKTSGLDDALKISILTGIILCDELEKEKNADHSNQAIKIEEDEKALNEIEERTAKILEKINQAMQ